MSNPVAGHDTLQQLVDAVERDGIDKVVAGAIIHDHGKVLILRRSPRDDTLPGIEELPSGGVEAGETILDGLRRELAEEVGAPATPSVEPEFVAAFDYVTGSGRRARQHTFAIAYSGHPIVLSAEHTAHRWIRPDELAGTDVTPETARTIHAWAASVDQ